jgi:peptidoglycan/LPS O-acetylase OafA/YrhL
LLFLIVLHYAWHFFYYWPQDKAKMNRYTLLALTYLSNWRSLGLPETSGPFPQLWSLACEEQFYIIWSVVLPFILARSNITRGLIISACVVLSIAVRLYVTMYPGVLWDMDWYSALSLNVYKMLIGSCLRLIPLPHQIKSTSASYIGLLAMAATIYLTNLPQPRYEDYYPGWGAHFKPVLTWSDILTTLSTSLVLCSVSTSPSGNFLLEWSPIKFIGRVSYAWYLWQIPILFLTQNTYTMWPAIGDSAVALLFAMFSTLYVEEPINAYYKIWRQNTGLLS